mgnify:CR=1 FL=1
MDATEAQLKFGASLTNSLDGSSSGGTGNSGSGNASGGSGNSAGGGGGNAATSQHAGSAGPGSGGGHRQVPAAPPLLASLAALGYSCA